MRGLGWLEIGLGLTPVAPLLLGSAGRVPLLAGTLAIASLALVMLVIHLVRLEPGHALVNAMLMGLALTIAWGRRRSAEPTAGR